MVIWESEILNDAIERAKKSIKSFCTEWIIKAVKTSENQIRFSNNEIDITKNWDEYRLNLFLSNNRRTTEIGIDDFRPNIIENTLKYCERLLKVAPINKNFRRIAEGPFKYDSEIQNKIYDDKILNLNEKADSIIENSIEAAINQGGKRVAGSFFFGHSNFLLESSTGIKNNFNRTKLYLRIRAFQEDMNATGEAITCSTHLNKGFDPIGAGEEAGEICKNSIGGQKGTPGIYNIIIYPKVSTELQAPTMAYGMNAYVKKSGLSWMAGKKLGDKIANNNITVWDDGKIEYGLNSSPFDDEGVPTKRTLLLNKGQIERYFTNTSFSRKNQESTGNAGITMPKPTNTIFESGDHTLKELMEISEKPTLLITSTWYTRYQSYAPPGIFSSIPKDGIFLVQNKGKTLKPIRELRINSDHFHLLKNTIALGKEIKQVSTWLSLTGNIVFAPFMLIEDIRMTTGTK